MRIPRLKAKNQAVLPEHAVQTQAVSYLRLVLPKHWRVVAITNKTLSARDGANDKAAGLTPGIPDLQILGEWHPTVGGLLVPWVWFLETKRPEVRCPVTGRRLQKAGDTSKAQVAAHADLTRLGFRVAVYSSLEELKRILAQWEIPTRDTGWGTLS